MRNTTRRYLAIFMAFIMSISIAFGLRLPAKAATVEYVYGTGNYKNYIYNWGTREEVATFLSPNAEEFYEENNVTYEQLAALSGSSNTSSVPSSALYKKLQSLMRTAHTTINNYDKVKYLCDYTDCQNSKKTSNKISSFYSGAEIGPGWTYPEWNREHVWPNSKGNQAGNGENDIMMLRPTASSENGSRGNKAYGPTTTSSYFNPNHFANGRYDLRGDVSRILLYQYVRWGATDRMWGSSGVIQSKEILLQWMEEDPVDTWELGRNDSVQSITGTRNVFVDYPELAFELFNEEIPNDYTTPSGAGTTGGYKITATSNNTAWGNVSVNGNTINASAVTGYDAVGFDVIKGTAEVTRQGDSFIVEASSDVTIRINFAARESKTVIFSEDGSSAGNQSIYIGGTITLPAHKTALKSGYTFIGWSEATFADTTSKPDFLEEGSKYIVRNDATLYALYSRNKNGVVYYFTNSPTGCTHTRAYKFERVEPTCKSPGTTEGMYCPDCSAFISGHQKLSNANIDHKYNSKGVCTVCGDTKANSNTSTSSKTNSNNVSSKDNQGTSNKPTNSTSSKNNQSTSSKGANNTTSKNENSTSSKPSGTTSSRVEQNVSSKPIGNTSSKDELNTNSNTVGDNEQNTSSVIAETEAEDIVVTVNISENTLVVSDFIKEAINNNIPLVLKAKDYTWNFEKIAISPDEAKSFDATILTGDEVSEGHKSIIKNAAKSKDFFPISFAHSGALPAKATITINVDEAFAGQEVEVYSIAASGSAVLEGKATVSSDAVLSFDTERTSLYFVTKTTANNSASLLWLWILIAVVLVGGGVTVFVLYKKGVIFNAKKQDLA
ncbi:MAG: endonuclease [Oscillospiraceae bacterium]|nr:endonuclease [Oscillospiraceae bacterium]